MHVQAAETWVYHPDGRRQPSQTTTHPSWSEIEAAVRRLDQQTYPILFLWASSDPMYHMVDEFSERLEVVGGNGTYWVAGTFAGYFQRRFLDPAGGPGDVELYGRRIELGFGSPARHICRDVEVVLRIVRYYADHGGFDPSVLWEEKPLLNS